jgi:GNAT superfamily N-acetyltransferase
VNLRAATGADEGTLRELWDEALAEAPLPAWAPVEPWESVWEAMRAAIGGGSVQLVLDDDGPAGALWAGVPDRGRSRIELFYVRPRARRQGFAHALLRSCLGELGERGATSVALEAPEAAPGVRSAWHRLGFEDVAWSMAAPVGRLAASLDDDGQGPSRASIHVQTDDRRSVERAIAQFLPRLPSPSFGDEARGWIRVTDPLLDTDGDARDRFARDLSDRLGTVSVVRSLEHGAVVRYRLFEHGRLVDEYLSVPNFYGELSKVDELGMAANPTLVSRLTGAAFADVRRVARTAVSPAELPPADELYEQVARLMGLEP